jgi:D-alanyl-lipoteichoic acid acyltransferase DltB (MBOAT superfamily)
MVFSSATFIVGFLPLVLLGFLVFAGTGQSRMAAGWLTLASLVFYGWWNPWCVPLLMASILANYLLGGYLLHRPSRTVLVLGIIGNLLPLLYYKYTTFLLTNIDTAFGLDWQIREIVLPLAISFFTFQQIAYLSDAHDGAVVEHDFLNYCLFITFFPHLIAGPITHHREMLSQFGNPENFRPRFDNISIGLTLFGLGLAKKVILADPLGALATPAFAAAAGAESLALLDAWGAALAYALQIYFDFSGYTDMALGIALMLGVVLPQNFDVPYRAVSLQDFWRRWHMTLSRFLRDYLYVPLGGNRHGLPLQLWALFATMTLGGLWHGAGLTFVAWGVAHGLGLGAVVLWRRAGLSMPAVAGWALTIVFVALTWVLFRATTFEAALAIYKGLFGFAEFGSMKEFKWRTTLAAAAVACLGPTSWALVHRLPARRWVALAFGLALAAVLLKIGDEGNYEFIYFQF